MKYFIDRMVFPVFVILVLGFLAFEKVIADEEDHDDYHENVVNVENTNINNTAIKNFKFIPDVQYQFNPDSEKYQMSLGVATSNFKGNNSAGIAFGKKLCNPKCENAFIHGSIKTNGTNTGGNIGLTFSWN